MAVDCCRYVTGTEWVTGGSDGVVALWSQMKKKPVSVVRGAHGFEAGEEALGAGSVGGDAASWVASVAVCHNSDLVVSSKK
jgi:ribosomal RNA-processing protein 9